MNRDKFVAIQIVWPSDLIEGASPISRYHIKVESEEQLVWAVKDLSCNGTTDPSELHVEEDTIFITLGALERDISNSLKLKELAFYITTTHIIKQHLKQSPPANPWLIIIN